MDFATFLCVIAYLTFLAVLLNKCPGECSKCEERYYCEDEECEDEFDKLAENAVTNADQREEDIEQEVPLELPKTPFEVDFDERVKRIKAELADKQISKTPPPFFDYDEKEILNVDKSTEIITEEYEKEQEHYLKMR